MLNPALPKVEQLYQSFSIATPFKHICIDDFLEPDLAEQLLQQFPQFDVQRAKNEMGQIGGKSTQENVRALGPAYQAFDDFFSSPKFLSYLSKLTGIPNLLFDPEYFGGGTHENKHGQELDIHVDFNYHRSSNLHRRLNLIVYLNHDWDPAWGGNIGVHSDPRHPEQDRIVEFAPLFNRCVIFETNEYSWHGFTEINIPADKRHLSRKSMTVYYYTKDRPEKEIVPPHNTFYIQRPLPPTIKSGEVLQPEQLKKIRQLIGKRDTWIEFYHNLELRLNGEIAGLRRYLREIEESIAPVTLGYFSQIGKVEGYFPDRWITTQFSAPFMAHRPITSLSVELVPAGELPRQNKVTFLINQQPLTEVTVTPGERVSIQIPFTCNAHDKFSLSINSPAYFSPKELGLNSDERKLVCVIESITAHH